MEYGDKRDVLGRSDQHSNLKLAALKFTALIRAVPRPLRGALPSLVCIVWICLVGFLVWRHALSSQQPLIGDARGYWMKARSFWTVVAERSWFNPFDIEPSKRPPGSVLLSYPFGFSESFKGFLFRSVWLPIVLTMSAVLIAGRSIRRHPGGEIDHACIATFICAAPLFYHFEYTLGMRSPTYWGLVDNFIGATAAIATAFALYAVSRPSKAAAVGAAFFASLSFVTKPTGLLVILLIAISWIIVAIGMTTNRRWSDSTTAGSPSICSAVIGLAIYWAFVSPVIIVARFFSDYFSSDNVAYGNRALSFLREAWILSTVSADLRNIAVTLGPFIVLWMVTTLAIGVLRLRTIADRDSSVERRVGPLSALCGLLFAATGVWFWLIYSGGSQIRYVYPFAMPVLILLIPITLDRMSEAGPRTRFALRILLLLPALNITMLLVAPQPSVSWQIASGVNVAIAKANPEMVLGTNLLRYARDSGRDVTVYEDFSGRSGIVDSFWGFERSANPSLPNVHVRNPVDFVRTATFRIREISDADFLLFQVITDPDEIARHLKTKSVNDFASENSVFQAWISSLGTRDGVRTFADSGDLKLLQIVNRPMFEKSLDAMVQAHQWRSVFLDANPKAWWSESEILQKPNLAVGRDGSLVIGERIELRAVSITSEPDQLTLNIWWRTLDGAPIGNDSYFFVHEMDASGTPLDNANVHLQELPGADTRSRYMLQSLIVPVHPGTTPSALGVGIFRLVGGKAETLPVASGQRDWGNHRAIISLVPASTGH